MEVLKISEVVDMLINKNVGIIPTDTLFALTADARDERAVSRIFDIKRRPAEKSFPIFIPSVRWLLEHADISGNVDVLLRLSNLFWPGPLTVVARVKFGFNLPDRIFSNGFVALRSVSSPVVQKIFDNIDFPIVGTSANISGGPNPLLFSDIDVSLLEDIDFYIKGGLIYYFSSTVVKIDDRAEILREGVISRALISGVLNGK